MSLCNDGWPHRCCKCDSDIETFNGELELATRVKMLEEHNEALQNDLLRSYQLLTTKTSKMLTEILGAKNQANTNHFKALAIEEQNKALCVRNNMLGDALSEMVKWFGDGEITDEELAHSSDADYNRVIANARAALKGEENK